MVHINSGTGERATEKRGKWRKQRNRGTQSGRLWAATVREWFICIIVGHIFIHCTTLKYTSAYFRLLFAVSSERSMVYLVMCTYMYTLSEKIKQKFNKQHSQTTLIMQYEKGAFQHFAWCSRKLHKNKRSSPNDNFSNWITTTGCECCLQAERSHCTWHRDSWENWSIQIQMFLPVSRVRHVLKITKILFHRQLNCIACWLLQWLNHHSEGWRPSNYSQKRHATNSQEAGV